MRQRRVERHLGDVTRRLPFGGMLRQPRGFSAKIAGRLLMFSNMGVGEKEREHQCAQSRGRDQQGLPRSSAHENMIARCAWTLHWVYRCSISLGRQVGVMNKVLVVDDDPAV